MPIQNPERFKHLNFEKKSIKEERLHRKQKLAAACRIFGALHLTEGTSGHITVRDPEHKDAFWLNPFGVSFNQIKVSDLILCSGQGTLLEGTQKQLNRAAFAIHSSIHQARPDVIACAHAHSLYGTTWATLGRVLLPITQSSCAFFEDHALFDDYTGVVVTSSEGARIAQTLKEHKAVILKNHGLLTVGRSVDEAAWWFISMERACHTQILAESTKSPLKMIDRDTALHTRNNAVGFPLAGWHSFQPLWQDIILRHPEIFE
jgi:ribulose-5-phosphate 4-epimerase/fuculose-1-phosphate aldolase